MTIMKNTINLISVKFFTIGMLLVTTIASAKNDIPDSVEKTLSMKFPNAENIAWQQYMQDEYLAVFVVDEEEINVFISDKGEFIECNVVLHESHIPAKIVEKLSALPDGGDVHYILSTVNSKGFQFYRAKVKIENKHFEFLFDQYYNLIAVKPIAGNK